MDDCIVTRSLDEFKRYLDPSTIPALVDNPSIAFDLAAAPAQRTRIYVIKPQAGASLLDLMETPERCVASTDDLVALRVFHVNEAVFARERAEVDHDESYSALLSSFTDPAFVGVLIINVRAAPKNPAELGPPALVSCFSFVAPCIELTGFDFSGNVPVPRATHARGYLTGTPSSRPYDVAGQTGDFSFRTDRLCVRYADGRLFAPSLSCALQIRSLFSQRVATAPYLQLLGTYTKTAQQGTVSYAYRFSLARAAVLPFSSGTLTSASIERATTTFSFDETAPRLRIVCEGALQFGLLSETFDPLSFGIGPSASGPPEQGYLAYAGLDLAFVLSSSAPSFTASYRTLTVDERASRARAQSLARRVPHLPISVLTFQNAATPENLGFRPVAAPAMATPALEKGDAWYGFVVPIEFTAGMRIELLCAFSGTGACSCFSRFAGGVGSDVVELAFSSFFSVSFKEVVLQAAAGPSGQTAYTVLLRGLKMKAMGAQLPEGACDIALAWNGGKAGWYAVYDRRPNGHACKEADHAAR